MKDYRRIFWRILLHGALASPFFALGYYLLATAVGGWAAVPRLLYGMGALLAGAVVLAPPFAQLVAESSGDLFYPMKLSRRVPPMYSIPQSKAKKGEYEAALLEYEQIVAAYPDQSRAYSAMIEIALLDLKDRARASWICTRAIKCLRKESDRLAVWYTYRTAIERERERCGRGGTRPSIPRHPVEM